MRQQMDEIDRLLQLVRIQGHDVWVGGPASTTSVAQLQEAIGVTIPLSLGAFLTKYGALGVYDNFLSGIVENDPLSTDCGGIYGDTLVLREDPATPKCLWAIYRHEDGAYCIDISRPVHDGEFAIVNYEHGSNQHNEILTVSYWDFAKRWFLQGWVDEPA